MIKEYSGSLYGTYRTKKFGDVWTDVEAFIADYQNIGIPATIPVSNSTDTTAGTATTLYYLLYSRYANDVIASSDLNRFKYNLFSIIWQYGPNWAKNLDIQNKLRSLSEDELTQGSIQIYNMADNPSTDPSTESSEYLRYIKSQNTSNNKKGKLEAYSLLDSMLKKDVTQDFLNKFKKLFKVVLEPEQLLLYEEIDDGSDNR